MKYVLADRHAKPLSRKEIARLLARPNILRVAFVDRKGEPVVHPVWYHYGRGTFYFATDTDGAKADVMRYSPTVYFLVDEVPEGRPSLGVRGKGIARVVDDAKYATEITKRCVKKYLGTTTSKTAKTIIAMGADSCVVEITPKFIASWKF
jgi:nitroimidazol reductase NimA-like FMN-containing flavoprotein (pyridoxamine 5'-phosphate oxidase superfamily)